MCMNKCWFELLYQFVAGNKLTDKKKGTWINNKGLAFKLGKIPDPYASFCKLRGAKYLK